MLRILDDRQAALAAWCRARLETELGGQGRRRGGAGGVGRARAGPVDVRVTALAQLGARRARWTRPRATPSRTSGRTLRARTRDVDRRVGGAAHRSRGARARASRATRPGAFSAGQLDDVHRWCVARERLRTGAAADEDDEPFALDAEDDALLLRIYQLPARAGSPTAARGVLAYEHLMVDEVQDFSPLELAVLLETHHRAALGHAGGRHRAGDRARARLLELGRAARRSSASRTSASSRCASATARRARSSTCAEHVLGPLQGDVRPVAPRAGAPVESFAFASAGECARVPVPRAQGAGARRAARRRSRCSRATPSRRGLYYEALVARRGADPAPGRRPGLLVHRRHRRHRRPPVEGARVRHRHPARRQRRVVPGDDDARRLLHVAMTRAAHQLWVTYTGPPSPLATRSPALDAPRRRRGLRLLFLTLPHSRASRGSG